jgi:hypothetical protein
MPAKLQTRWAIVHRSGYVSHGYMCFTRRDVIKGVLDEHRHFQTVRGYGLHTDAEFWRVLKRRRGWQVRRVSLRVVR